MSSTPESPGTGGEPFLKLHGIQPRRAAPPQAIFHTAWDVSCFLARMGVVGVIVDT